MRIEQHAQFRVGSDVFDPGQITALLLIEPNRVARRGSRRTDPPVPPCHLWAYQAVGTGKVHELISKLLDVFEPLHDQLHVLTADGASWIVISVARSFEDPDGVDDDEGGPDLPSNVIRLGGQHQLLGFHLDAELMGRLVALGCSLDFDEFG